MHHELLYQSIPHSYTLLHNLSIDGIAVGGVVGEVGEGLGEGAEGGGCLRDGFQRGCGDTVETALCEQCPGDDGLSSGSNILVERCQLVAGFNAIVVGEDEAVVEVVVHGGALLCDSDDFHSDFVGASQVLADF